MSILIVSINTADAFCMINGYGLNATQGNIGYTTWGYCQNAGEYKNITKSEGQLWQLAWGGFGDSCNGYCGNVWLNATNSSDNVYGFANKGYPINSSNMGNWAQTGLYQHTGNNITLNVTPPVAYPTFTQITIDSSNLTNPTNNDTNVTFTATATDAQADQWYMLICNDSTAVAGGACGGVMLCNGTQVASGAASTCQIDISSEVWETNGWWSYACDVNQNCGSLENTSAPYNVNHPPTAATPTIGGGPYNSSSTIPCTNGTVADPDTTDGPSANQYRWYNNGTYFAAWGAAATLNCGAAGTCNKTINVSCANNAIDTHGYAGSYSSTSNQVTIAGVPPTIAAQNSFVNFTNQHAFNVSATGADGDGLSDIASCTIWRREGADAYVSEVGTYTSATGICIGKINTTDSDAGGAFAVFDSVDVFVQFTDVDGGNVNTTSSANAIPNNLPVASAVAINVTNPLDTQDIQCNYTYSDPDSDAEAVTTFEWYRNNAPMSINNQILKAGNTTNGEQWICEVTPVDVYQAGNAINSTTQTVGGISLWDVYLTMPTNQSVLNTSSAIYEIQITNNGTTTDNFTVSANNLDTADTAQLNQTSILNLAATGTANFTLTVNDTTPNNYTVRITVTSTINATATDTEDVETEITAAPAAPTLSATAIYPYALQNGTNVLLYISAVNPNATWAQLEHPDLSKRNITLTNNANTTYTNTSLLGRYNVTFYMNDSVGTIQSATDYFQSFNGIQFNTTVTDSTGAGINSSLIAYYRDGAVASNASTTGNYSQTMPNVLMDLQFIREPAQRLRVTLNLVNLTTNNNRIFSMERLGSAASGYLATYAVNTTYNFPNASIILYYDDVQSGYSSFGISQCSNWSFTGQNCTDGNWTSLSATHNTSAYYFEVNVSSFSGFSISGSTTPAPTPTPTPGGSSRTSGSSGGPATQATDQEISAPVELSPKRAPVKEQIKRPEEIKPVKEEPIFYARGPLPYKKYAVYFAIFLLAIMTLYVIAHGYKRTKRHLSRSKTLRKMKRDEVRDLEKEAEKLLKQ